MGPGGPEFEARQCLFSALWDPGKRRNLREGTRFLVCTATIIGALTSRMCKLNEPVLVMEPGTGPALQHARGKAAARAVAVAVTSQLQELSQVRP